MATGIQEPLEPFATSSLFDEEPEEPIGADVAQADALPGDCVAERDDVVVLDDLDDMVYRLFNVWVSGSEFEWVEYAWAALTRQGLTGWTDEVERTLVVCRLAALSALYREFVVYAFDEGSLGDWVYRFGNVDFEGQGPYLHSVTVGRVAQKLDVWAECAVGDREEVGDLVIAIARHQAPLVAAALREDLGDYEVLTSMFVTPRHGVSYPVDDEGWEEIGIVDGDQVRAWLWIEDGMPLSRL